MVLRCGGSGGGGGDLYSTVFGADAAVCAADLAAWVAAAAAAALSFFEVLFLKNFMATNNILDVYSSLHVFPLDILKEGFQG